jgi:heme-degrading monooxygenase HmoA
VIALGRFRENLLGDLAPRQVLILVEWTSRDAFESYLSDPELADLHPHRERGAGRYVWQLFDRLDDLRPLLKDE